MLINNNLLNVLSLLIIPIYIVLLVSAFYFVISKFLKIMFEIDKFRNKTKSLVKDMDESYKFMNETLYIFKNNQKKMSEEMKIMFEEMKIINEKNKKGNEKYDCKSEKE